MGIDLPLPTRFSERLKGDSDLLHNIPESTSPYLEFNLLPLPILGKRLYTFPRSCFESLHSTFCSWSIERIYLEERFNLFRNEYLENLIVRKNFNRLDSRLTLKFLIVSFTSSTNSICIMQRGGIQHDHNGKRLDLQQIPPLERTQEKGDGLLKMHQTQRKDMNDPLKTKPAQCGIPGLPTETVQPPKTIARAPRISSITTVRNNALRGEGGPGGNLAISSSDRLAKALKEPLSADIRIPLCLLNGKSHLQRILFPASEAELLTTKSDDLYNQLLNNLLPPVTKETLQELGLLEIQNNLTLRIDLVFDQLLYFQPISGSRGLEKIWLAKTYWEFMSLELKTHLHELHDCEFCHANGGLKSYPIPTRLLKLFSTLRQLLEMLVPEAQKNDVQATLKIKEYVRRVRTGQFNAASFAEWLSKLITMHCAPLRDQMARDMQKKIVEGAKSGDMDTLVGGLSLLFELLEKMKLDVSNHQVRTFKYQLISDAVPFLQDCFSKMIKKKQFDLSDTRKWFDDNLKVRQDGSSELQRVPRNQYFDVFVQGTADLLKMGAEHPPSIFTYDKERLDALRNDFIDVVQWRICADTLKLLSQSFRGRQPSLEEVKQCETRVLQLIMPEGSHNEGVDCHLHSVSLEIARAAMGVSPEEIVMNADINADHLHHAHLCLQSNLSEQHVTVEEQFVRSLSNLVLQHAHRFGKMGTLQVSEEQRIWAEKRSYNGSHQASDLEDLARRTAHIAVLSWQVWSNLGLFDPETPALPGTGPLLF